MVRVMKVIGIIYSIVSAVLFPFLLFMQLFSAFLFDAPGSTESILPYLLALGIFLIPVILIVSNVLMWLNIKESRLSYTIVFMCLPFIYTICFFSIWSLAEKVIV